MPVLIELRGKNFGCFRDEFRLSMRAADFDPGDPRGLLPVQVEGESEPLVLLRSVAIYGPNASGKSTVLRAASGLNHLLTTSAQYRSDMPLQPYEPFLLDQRGAQQPVELGVTAVINHRVYEYDISFIRDRFLTERLTEKTAGSDEILIDRRDGQPVGGRWVSDETFGLVIRAPRANALLLSLADTIAPELAAGLAVTLRRLLAYYDASAHPDFPYKNERVAERLRQDPEFGDWLRVRLRDADTGVIDHETELHPGRSMAPSGPAGGSEDAPARQAYRLTLKHSGKAGSVALAYNRESRGTRRLVELSPMLFDLSHGEFGRAFFVDEFDASLHPALLSALLHSFNSELPENEVRGQLVFAAHETALIDDQAKDAVLRRDQVYFTEKDSNGAARLYSLVEFKDVRGVHNLRKRYLEGRYGALPVLGDLGG